MVATPLAYLPYRFLSPLHEQLLSLLKVSAECLSYAQALLRDKRLEGTLGFHLRCLFGNLLCLLCTNLEEDRGSGGEGGREGGGGEEGGRGRKGGRGGKREGGREGKRGNVIMRKKCWPYPCHWHRKMVLVRGATIMTHPKTSSLAFISLQTCFPNFQLNQKSRGVTAPLLPMPMHAIEATPIIHAYAYQLQPIT